MLSIKSFMSLARPVSQNHSIRQSLRALSFSKCNTTNNNLLADDMENLSAAHDEKNKEFYIKLHDDREKAVLQYAWTKSGVIDLYHTGVPSAFRGKGVAKILAKAALDYVVEKDVKMILSCTYLDKYVRDNPLPEYTSRTVGNGFSSM